jgi:hypothetical protein
MISIFLRIISRGCFSYYWGVEANERYRDLEVAVEKLSQLLQEEIDPATIKELRQNTINKTVNLLTYSL